MLGRVRLSQFCLCPFSPFSPLLAFPLALLTARRTVAKKKRLHTMGRRGAHTYTDPAWTRVQSAAYTGRRAAVCSGKTIFIHIHTICSAQSSNGRIGARFIARLLFTNTLRYCRLNCASVLCECAMAMCYGNVHGDGAIAIRVHIERADYHYRNNNLVI